MSRLNCQHCSESVLFDGDIIDSGMTIKCGQCGEDTIIDLFRPDERVELYNAMFQLRKE